MKRRILSERNLVVILFVMVFVIFSLAQEDTKKIEKMYEDTNAATTTTTTSLNPNQVPTVKATTNKDIIAPAQFR